MGSRGTDGLRTHRRATRVTEPRGTGSSNPPPSSGESTNHRFRGDFRARVGGKRRRIWLANGWPNLSGDCRTVSWLTMMPRAANNSSTMRRPSGKRPGRYTSSVRTAFQKAILSGLLTLGSVLADEVFRGRNLQESYGYGGEIAVYTGKQFEFVSGIGFFSGRFVSNKMVLSR
jgi:hypothetical protein